MDTWMGRNQDPITLHKYLYANANPVNMIDPTGNFSMVSVMSAVNVANTLATVAETSYDIFQMSDAEEFSATDAGIAILLGMSGGSGKLLKMINRKLCGKKGCKVPPMIDEKHIFLGEIVQKSRGTQAQGYHSEADSSTRVQVLHRSAPKLNGAYKATIKIFNSKTGGYKKKNRKSTMFPRFWTKQMVSASLYAAWNKGNGKAQGTVRVGNMKIRYHVHNGIWLRGFPVLR